MTKSAPAADLGPRRYDLDWVRIGAFMLLILYHVGMYYVTWGFHVKSPHACLLARDGGSFAEFCRHALGAAILVWSALRTYFGLYNADAEVPPQVLRVIMRGAYGAEQWLAIAAILGFAHRHLMRDNAVRRYLTAAICFLAYELIRRVRLLQPLFGAGREANVHQSSGSLRESPAPAGSF